METWLRNNPSDKGGTHKYTGEQFGLSRALVEREAARYLDRFGALDRRACEAPEVHA